MANDDLLRTLRRWADDVSATDAWIRRFENDPRNALKLTGDMVKESVRRCVAKRLLGAYDKHLDADELRKTIIREAIRRARFPAISSDPIADRVSAVEVTAWLDLMDDHCDNYLSR